MMFRLPEHRRLQRLQGTVESEAGPWPDGIEVIVQVRSETSGKTINVRVIEGRIPATELPRGRYCFVAEAPGWQTAFGSFEGVPAAEPDQGLNVKLPLGV
ncbi:MAG: hypothetical protein QM736_03975 [Vicinamibacterales bacterium]